MSDQIHHFIDGKIVQGQSGRFGGVFNPAIGEETKQVALASKGLFEGDYLITLKGGGFQTFLKAPYT